MQCWDCSTTETLRVRSVPQGRALPLAFSLVVGAGVGSVLGPPECCCLQTWGRCEKTECGFSSVEAEGIQRGSVLLKVS